MFHRKSENLGTSRNLILVRMCYVIWLYILQNIFFCGLTQKKNTNGDIIQLICYPQYKNLCVTLEYDFVDVSFALGPNKMNIDKYENVMYFFNKCLKTPNFGKLFFFWGFYEIWELISSWYKLSITVILSLRNEII